MMSNTDSLTAGKPKISIVIPNYNKSYYTIPCVKSILENALTESYLSRIEVVIVSNGSCDEDLKKLEFLEADSVKLLRNATNLGFAGGNDFGYENSLGEIVVFLSHDTLITPGWFREIVTTFDEHPEVGAAQCKLVEMRDKETIQSSGTKINFSLGNAVSDQGRGQKTANYMARFQDIAGCGAALAVRRKMTNQLDMIFDPDFFVNFEDMDLSIRIFLLGYRVVLIPNCTVYHHDHNSNTLSDKEEIFRKYHTVKNVVCAYLKDLEPFNAFFNIGTFLILNLIISLAQSFYRKNYHYFLIYFKALFWNLANLTETLAKRKKIQSTRKVRDRFVFSKIGVGFFY